MRRAVMIACAALLFVPLYMKSRMSQEIPARAAFHVLSSGRVSVKVSGDVLHAGIYEVFANTLASSVIIMATPSHPHQRYKTGTSASRYLMNGSEVILSKQPDGFLGLTVGSMTVAERMVLGIPLDITTMSEADFDRLPGIGPALARRIIGFRQNNGGIVRVEDLAAVKGIGETKYKMIRTFFQPTITTE